MLCTASGRIGKESFLAFGEQNLTILTNLTKVKNVLILVSHISSLRGRGETGIL